MAVGARRFARNSFFGSVAGVLGALGSVISNILVARFLGVEQAGVVAYSLWTAIVAGSIADLGIQATLARYLPELTAATSSGNIQGFAAALLRPLAISSAVVCGAVLTYGIWQYQDGTIAQPAELLWVITALICILQTFSGFTYGLLRGMQRFDQAALLTCTSMLCQFLAIGVGTALFGTPGALAGYACGSVLPALYAIRYMVRRAEMPSGMWARVLRFSLYTWAGTLTSTLVWSRSELFFLQHYSGSSAVGLFTVSVTLANVAAQAPLLLTAGFLPYFAQSFGRRALAEARDAYGTAVRVLGLIIFPACLGMASILPAIVPTVYGQAFEGAIPATTVLLFAAAIASVTSVGTNVLLAMDRSDMIFRVGAGLAVLAIAAGLTIIPEYGLMGAAWTRAALQTISACIGTWFVSRRLGFPLPINGLVKTFVAAMICAALSRSCLFITTGPSAIVVAIAVGLVSYITAVRALGALHPVDAARLHQLSQGLPLSISNGIHIGLRFLTAKHSRPVELT